MAKKTRGTKMARSEVVSVRFDSKLMLATRFAAGHERRTITSYIEWAVEQVNRRIAIAPHWDAEPSSKPATAMDVAEQVWEPDEAKRLMHLATMYPELLTHEEETLWQLIWYSTAFSRPRTSVGSRGSEPTAFVIRDPAVYIDWDAVHQHWETLKRVAAGEAPASDLPKGKAIAESKTTTKQGGRRHG